MLANNYYAIQCVRVKRPFVNKFVGNRHLPDCHTNGMHNIYAYRRHDIGTNEVSCDTRVTPSYGYNIGNKVSEANRWHESNFKYTTITDGQICAIHVQWFVNSLLHT